MTASLAAGTGAPGALLLGDVSAPFSLGQAAFTDLAVDRAGSGYRVAFSHPPASPTRSGAFDVPLPVVAPADVALTEGNAGSQLAPFRFTLSGPSGLPVTVPFATRAGTAEPGLDYQEAAGTLTFAPGALKAVASVVVLGDRLPEPDEFFHLDAAGAVNATLAPSSVRGRVVDDDGGGIALLEASHGAQLVRSLPSSAQPRHLYLVAQQPRSSYEVTVDGASGDLGPGDGPALRRLAPDLTTVIQDSGPIGAGPARQIAWERSALTPTDSEYIEVASRECSTACGPDDVYRLRFRETTGSIPRFNNGSGQATTLVLLQNPGARAVSGTLWFLDASGDGIADVPFTVLARGLFTLATPGVPGLAGASGSITQLLAPRWIRSPRRQGGLAGAFERVQLRHAARSTRALTARSPSCGAPATRS